MAEAIEFGEEAARLVEQVYSRPAIVAQREHVLAALGLQPGERVLDIGAGPGYLAQSMAAVVGRAGRVCGLDTSESMLALGRTRCADQPWVEFDAGTADALPYPDDAFDVAVSTQVYEYVSDMPAALAELGRVLRPGGRALILDTDWESLVWHSSDPERMRRVMVAWDEHLPHPDLPRRLVPMLRRAGFQLADLHAFPVLELEYGNDAFSQGLAAMVAGFVPGRAGLTGEDAGAWLEDLAELGRAGEYFFSLNRYVFVAVKEAVTLAAQ